MINLYQYLLYDIWVDNYNNYNLHTIENIETVFNKSQYFKITSVNLDPSLLRNNNSNSDYKDIISEKQMSVRSANRDDLKKHLNEIINL